MLNIFKENEFGYLTVYSCCSVTKSCVSLQPYGLQHTRLPCPSLSPRVCSNSHPFSQWCHPTVSSSTTPFSFCPQSFPASGVFQWISSSYQVAKVLELQQQSFQWILRVYFLLDWLVGSPCSPRDSQESSPTPYFESINSSAQTFLWANSNICTWPLEKP